MLSVSNQIFSGTDAMQPHDIQFNQSAEEESWIVDVPADGSTSTFISGGGSNNQVPSEYIYREIPTVNLPWDAIKSEPDDAARMAAIQTPSECSFAKAGQSVCSPDAVVHVMAKFLNNEMRQNINPISKEAIVSAAKEVLGCTTENCVIRHEKFSRFAANAISIKRTLAENFKPIGPANHHGLLTNVNIDEVLEQLRKRHPKFYHVYFQMKGFVEMKKELAVIDLYNIFIRRGYTSLGCVLNTHPYSRGGEHWYCIYIHNGPTEIVFEYFNSSGHEAPQETMHWMYDSAVRLQKRLNDTNVPKKTKVLHYNTITFQSDDHSCGVYCLMYIWCRLEKISNGYFREDTFGDSLMEKARTLLFIPDRQASSSAVSV